MDTDLEFSNSLRSGATQACITKGLTGKKKKRKKEGVECLLIDCLYYNSTKLSNGHLSFSHSHFMVLGSTRPPYLQSDHVTQVQANEHTRFLLETMTGSSWTKHVQSGKSTEPLELPEKMIGLPLQ